MIGGLGMADAPSFGGRATPRGSQQRKDCDLFFSSGPLPLTNDSGMVEFTFPSIVLELSRRYRFRTLCGAALSATFAALVAAAEYGRKSTESANAEPATDPFDRLQQIAAHFRPSPLASSSAQPGLTMPGSLRKAPNTPMEAESWLNACLSYLAFGTEVRRHPLTFGDLWGSVYIGHLRKRGQAEAFDRERALTPSPQVGEPEPEIDLRLAAQDQATGTVHLLPLPSPGFVFEARELEAFLAPETLWDLISHSAPETRAPGDAPLYRNLPELENTPVSLALRLCGAFGGPAIPLYAAGPPSASPGAAMPGALHLFGSAGNWTDQQTPITEALSQRPVFGIRIGEAKPS